MERPAPLSEAEWGFCKKCWRLVEIRDGALIDHETDGLAPKGWMSGQKITCNGSGRKPWPLPGTTR